MNYGGDILRGIRELCDFFAARCEDRATLDELVAVSRERSRWRSAHGLFQRIRAKTLEAGRRDSKLETQYLFEEICAKSLYNLSGEQAPFDADSPYWIVPNALRLARTLAASEAEITRIVVGDGRSSGAGKSPVLSKDDEIERRLAENELLAAVNALRKIEGDLPLGALPEPPYCSFCGRSKSEAGALIEGNDAHICAQCTDEARRLLIRS